VKKENRNDLGVLASGFWILASGLRDSALRWPVGLELGGGDWARLSLQGEQ